MSESQPLACTDCQKLLSCDPDTLHLPDVRTHLAGCAMCGHLAAQYCEMDRLLQQIPDLKALPDLGLSFQHIPQAQHISELPESFASWEEMLEEHSSAHSFKPWLDEPAISSLAQGNDTLQKRPLDHSTRPSHVLNTGQFQSPLHSTPRPHHSFKRGGVATVAVLLALVTIVSWMLLPHLTHRTTPAGHGLASPTQVLVTPTPTPGLTQQYAFTAQDSGKTIRYGITTRFSLRLNQQVYPQQKLQLSCEPQGILGSITGAPYAASPLYAVEYQANEAGTCTFKNGGFILTIVIVQ